MEKPRASLLPLALAALASCQDAPEQAQGRDDLSPDQRIEKYLNDLKRYTRGMIQDGCSYGSGRAILSNYGEETFGHDSGFTGDFMPGAVWRNIIVDQTKQECAHRVTRSIDNRLGEARNVDVKFMCDSPATGNPPTSCRIQVSTPRHRLPNSLPR